jgi:hypothetical protein
VSSPDGGLPGSRRDLDVGKAQPEPNAEPIAYARKVIAAFGAAPVSLVVFDGKLIELPVARSARRTLAIAAATGAAGGVARVRAGP